MISAKLVAMSENFDVGSTGDGYDYSINHTWIQIEGGEMSNININRSISDDPMAILEALGVDGEWHDYKEDGEDINFETIDEAFGFLNNLLLDKLAIGNEVSIDTSNRGVEGHYEGTLIINTNYNDQYPYKVRMTDGSVGVFSINEVKAKEA